MRRTGGLGDRKRKGGSAQPSASYKLDIGKLISLIQLIVEPIDYIKETPPPAVSQLVLSQDILS